MIATRASELGQLGSMKGRALGPALGRLQYCIMHATRASCTRGAVWSTFFGRSSLQFAQVAGRAIGFRFTIFPGGAPNLPIDCEPGISNPEHKVQIQHCPQPSTLNPRLPVWSRLLSLAFEEVLEL